MRLGISRSILGAEHPSTLTAMSNLAVTYSHQGRWTEAKKLELHALETSTSTLEAEHPDTLTRMANLTEVRVQGA